MEGFSIKIDKNLKSNLHKICRLCGIDYPEKIKVNDENSIVHLDDGELELCVKIFICIGVRIKNDDEMPQTICTLCFDKINDFFEFREMCSTTQAQTRILLGLPEENKYADLKTKLYDSPKTFKTLTKTGTKRKKISPEEEVLQISQKHLKNDVSAPMLSVLKKHKMSSIGPVIQNDKQKNTEKKSVKLKSNIHCLICLREFDNIFQQEEHMKINHIPAVFKYHCVYCNETLFKPKEIKSHNLMHKLSKTPFQCGRCSKKICNANTYSKHIRDCMVVKNVCKLIPDKACPICNELFPTTYLFNIHSCSINRKNCPGCKKFINTTEEMKTHVPYCRETTRKFSEIVNLKKAKFIKVTTPQTTAIPSRPFSAMQNVPEIEIKTETNGELNSILNKSIDSSLPIDTNHFVVIPPNASLNKLSLKKNKRVTKKNLKRIDNLIKNTMTTLENIKQEPNQNDVQATEDTNDSMSLESHSEIDILDNYFAQYHDAHHGEYEDIDDNIIPLSCVTVKQEIIDENYPDMNESIGTIKQEIDVEESIDSSIPNCLFKVDNNDSKSDNDQSLYKPLLKLKIKKEHGQLNSTLIDSYLNGEKKKKKRKKSEKPYTLPNNHVEKPQPTENESFSPTTISIKEEVLDDENYENEIYPAPNLQLLKFESKEDNSNKPTKIQILSVASGFNFSDGKQKILNPSGSKLPLITSVSCGAQIPSILESLGPKISSINDGGNIFQCEESSLVSSDETVDSKTKQCNEHFEISGLVDIDKTLINTSNLQIKRENHNSDDEVDYNRLPKNEEENLIDNEISILPNPELIRNGVDLSQLNLPYQNNFEVVIKKEERHENDKTAEIKRRNGFKCEEEEYIKNIDFNCIQIKEEIEFSEETMHEQQFPSTYYKGKNNGDYDGIAIDEYPEEDDDEDYDDGFEDDDDEDEDKDDGYKIKGIMFGQYPSDCEYRELEIEEESDIELAKEETNIDCNRLSDISGNVNPDEKKLPLDKDKNICSTTSAQINHSTLKLTSISVDRLKENNSLTQTEAFILSPEIKLTENEIKCKENRLETNDNNKFAKKSKGSTQDEANDFKISVNHNVETLSEENLGTTYDNSLVQSLMEQPPTTSTSFYRSNNFENADEIAENNNNANIEKELNHEQNV